MSQELENKITEIAAEGCCGGPAPTGVDACCVSDADAKASGDDGCGCDTEPKKSSNSCC